jgi:hypothetical protein
MMNVIRTQHRLRSSDGTATSPWVRCADRKEPTT